MDKTPIIKLDHVHKRFTRSLDMAEKIANIFGAGMKDQVVRAVDDVSFDGRQGRSCWPRRRIRLRKIDAGARHLR